MGTRHLLGRRILLIGGTGVISAACSRQAAAPGADLYATPTRCAPR
ncbi:hypothetical protein [Streptomyces sp. NPDC048636]